jgi:opacity protein-like surface antigen
MKKVTILAVGLLLLVPALSFSDSISLRLGYYIPRGLSDTYLAAHPDSLWRIEFDQMSFRPSDYRGGTIGIAYDYFVGKNLSLSLSLDSYSKGRLGYYNDWVLNTLTEGDFAFPYEYFEGDDIMHSFRISVTPVELSLKFLPLGRRAKLIPYVGGGATMAFWGVRMFGDMVNFSDPWVYTDPDLGDIDIYPVESVNGLEHGTAFGWHAFGGIQVPIGYRATIEAEARYRSVKAHYRDWFQGFEDQELGGLALTIGVSYWF